MSTRARSRSSPAAPIRPQRRFQTIAAPRAIENQARVDRILAGRAPVHESRGCLILFFNHGGERFHHGNGDIAGQRGLVPYRLIIELRCVAVRTNSRARRTGRDTHACQSARQSRFKIEHSLKAPAIGKYIAHPFRREQRIQQMSARWKAQLQISGSAVKISKSEAALQIEKDSLVRPLQHNIPFKRVLVPRNLPRNQCLSAIRRNQLQHGVFVIARIARKIDSSKQVFQQSARKYGHYDVWRLQSAAGPRYPAGFNRAEMKTT